MTTKPVRTKMTVALAKEIAKEILSDSLPLLVEEICDRGFDLAHRIHDEIRPESLVKAIEAIPADFRPPTQSKITVTVSNNQVCSFDLGHRAVPMPNVYGKYALHDWMACVTTAGWEKIMEAVGKQRGAENARTFIYISSSRGKTTLDNFSEVLRKDIEAFLPLLNRFRSEYAHQKTSEIVAVLRKSPTVEAIETEWPEAWVYARRVLDRKDAGKTATNLPAVSLAALNADLGLPVEVAA